MDALRRGRADGLPVKLRFHILGFEIANVELELDEKPAPVTAPTVVDRGVQRMSKAWVKRMFPR